MGWKRITAAIFLAACSSSTDVDPREAQARGLLQAELSLLPSQYFLLSLDRLELIGTSIALVPLRQCVPDSTGVWELNEHGVPRDLTLTYPPGRCTTNVGPFIERYHGVIRIQDPGGGALARITYTGLTRRLSGTASATEEIKAASSARPRREPRAPPSCCSTAARTVRGRVAR
jgi:hypothetical protein